MPIILLDLPAPMKLNTAMPPAASTSTSPATRGDGQKERQEDGDQVHHWQGGEEDDGEGED